MQSNTSIPEALGRPKIQPVTYGDGFTHDERTHAVNELREWVNLDTWTVREGLLLLAGIDPHRADCWKLTDQGFETETQPAWARITASPGFSVDDVDANGMPRITGYVLDLNQAVQLSKLLNLWVSKPGHALQDRCAPYYYIEWATSKGHPPFWKPWAFDAGLLPELPSEHPVEPVMALPMSTDARSTKERRQDSSLTDLRKLGGDVVPKNGGLHVNGITKLVTFKTATDAPARTEKTVRADVKAAYKRETEAKRSGLFKGLGSL